MAKIPYLYQRFIDDFNECDNRLTMRTKEAMARIMAVRISKKDAKHVMKDLEKYGATKRKSRQITSIKHNPTV